MPCVCIVMLWSSTRSMRVVIAVVIGVISSFVNRCKLSIRFVLNTHEMIAHMLSHQLACTMCCHILTFAFLFMYLLLFMVQSTNRWFGNALFKGVEDAFGKDAQEQYILQQEQDRSLSNGATATHDDSEDNDVAVNNTARAKRRKTGSDTDVTTATVTTTTTETTSTADATVTTKVGVCYRYGVLLRSFVSVCY
jgi:hypothetical protein